MGLSFTKPTGTTAADYAADYLRTMLRTTRRLPADYAADYAADYPQTQIMPQTAPPTTPGRRSSPRPNKAFKTRLLQLLRSLDLDSFLFAEMLLDAHPVMILWEGTCRVVVQVTQALQSVSSSKPEQQTSYCLSGHVGFASRSNITIFKL